ncbi:hypothetical protein Halha_0955 [Halobacteroides halobius DSM 5150]|uniref:Uncharacterized protein n=1 Tax=Halobacteroides halobius (strain ATCC 35273 / DSM 5150 / MD-1) TaxID=748449 RepID=L0K7D5_HALHC|nr:hypothetical protein [Halobacteroides halobius]AGB40916.1 hypothetical protein Halha_0955 [Halobacteroides halobius DSM 5150]
MKEKYCAKCDVYYYTPEGEKEIADCPFCSLGGLKNDNLTVRDKMVEKNYKNFTDKKGI